MYAKIFAQMYDGSLCTQGPWEALVTFQQMLVLADQDGNVDMTAEAISRRTTIPLEIIQRGIAELLKPDEKSRTPNEDGRRLVPLSEGRDWGWLVVNYKLYRQLRREEDRREYHREYWHKRKTQHTQHTQPNQPIAYAEAEAEAEAKPKASPGGFEIPDWIPRDAWDGFIAMRKASKKAPTREAMVLAVAKLGKLKASGEDVRAVLEQSVLSGWSGLFPVSRARKPVAEYHFEE